MAADGVPDARWLAYLYERHSPAELRGWANRLAVFRFCRAFGGHANDSDQLTAAFAVPTEADLREALTAIGVVPTVAQPGWVRIADADVHTWVSGGRLTLTISDADSPYDVTEAAVRAAEAVEPVLAPIRALVIDPPLDRAHCICPKYYPDLWS
ncbi:hypothetical protein [Nocardioides speluncae]|uniref:hypothetical protein n=1 Tax=Nocardioides speluncae TaxID=2670337 RepID=UPI000D68FC9F|nr:hypothetical protein [Nocardioides speluncae]